MIHNAPLIATMATGISLAFILGFLAVKIRLSALVGYLLAGFIVGPYTPGFVADMNITGQLAEIGIILLMFGVGLHFSLDDLLKVRKIALPGAILQILVATVLGASIATLWGWSLGASLVFGLSLSVASTVVLLRAFQAHGPLKSMNGRIAVGWLIVEDIVMVLVLVLLPLFSSMLGGKAPSGSEAQGIWQTLGLTLFGVFAFIALMLIGGRRLLPAILFQVARTGSRELFTLCIITMAIGIAYVATSLFGVSLALGAFFAGMVMQESEFSRRATEESLPLRDAFSVLFFVSVGMLFNPATLINQPLHILAVVGIIIIGKSIAAACLVLALRYPLNTALTVSASLAQIGEFSFILAALGVQLELLPVEGQSLILAGALISITLNPFVFASVKPFQTWILSHSTFARMLEQPTDQLSELPATTEEKYLSKQVVLVGHGRVGRRIASVLEEQDIPFIVIEQHRELVKKLRAERVAAVLGNASNPRVLNQVHINKASMLVVATPDTFDVQQMIENARLMNPEIEIIVRTHNEKEADLLKLESAEKVFIGERELAKSMTRYVLKRYGKLT